MDELLPHLGLTFDLTVKRNTHQTSHLRLTAYRVDDNAIQLIIIGFVAHTGYFHACLPGDEGDEFSTRSDSLLIMPSSDSLPTLGTSTPVSKGTRGTSFLHTFTKRHASDSLLIVSMIMLTHHHRILRPHQVLPRLSPRGRGGRVLHTLRLTAYHAIIGFFAHTRNFHTCLQGDEGDKFSTRSDSLLIMPSLDSLPTPGTSTPVSKGTRGTSFSCLQKRYYFCSVSRLSLRSELSTQSLLQLLRTEPILILSLATSSLVFHLTYFYTG